MRIYRYNISRCLDNMIRSNVPSDLRNKFYSIVSVIASCNNDFDKKFLSGFDSFFSVSINYINLVHDFVKNFDEKDLLKLRNMLCKYYNKCNIDSNKIKIYSILDSFFCYVFKDPNIKIFKSVSNNLDIRKLFFLFQGASEGKFYYLEDINNLDDEKFYDVISKYLDNVNLDMLKYVLENDITLSQFYFFSILNEIEFDLDIEYINNIIEEVKDLYNVYIKDKQFHNYFFSEDVYYCLPRLNDSFLLFYYKNLYYKGVNLFLKEHLKRKFRLFLIYLVEDFEYSFLSKKFSTKDFDSFFDLLSYNMMYYKYNIYNNLEVFSRFIELYSFLITHNNILTRSIDSDDDRKLFLDYIFNSLLFDPEKIRVMLESIKNIGCSLYEDFIDTSLSKISKFLSIYSSDLYSFFIFLKEKNFYFEYRGYIDADRRKIISLVVSAFVDYMLSESSKKRTLKFNFYLFKKIFLCVVVRKIKCNYLLLFLNGKKSITMLKFYYRLN